MKWAYLFQLVLSMVCLIDRGHGSKCSHYTNEPDQWDEPCQAMDLNCQLEPLKFSTFDTELQMEDERE